MGRWVDLIIVTLAVALGAYAFHAQATRETLPSAAPSTAVEAAPSAVGAPASAHRAAPPFTTTDVDSRQSYFYDGKRAAFIVLTAIECKDCRNRVPTDREAVALARKAGGLMVLNLLVYAEPAAGCDFAKQFKPEADHVLADPGGAIGVGKYGGNDDQVWILVDDNGHILWQGRPDLPTFRQRLSLLTSQRR